MTIEEFKQKLLELQEVAESDNESSCDDILNCIFNENESLGDKVRPYIQDLRKEIDSNINCLFEQIFELISKLK